MPGDEKLKLRLDIYLVNNSLAETRNKAQGLILAKKVKVNGVVITKAGRVVSAGDKIQVKEDMPFVSRGGLKLNGVLKSYSKLTAWLKEKTVLDLGASTGGFTDCLLQSGASLVIALDVGYGQLHPRLAKDKRVRVMDRKNARLLEASDFRKDIFPDFFTADLSFISLKKILPVIKNIFGNIPGLILVKPQFELDPYKNEKGVVRKNEYKLEAVKSIFRNTLDHGWSVAGLSASGILGPKGNQEFWLFILDPVKSEELLDVGMSVIPEESVESLMAKIFVTVHRVQGSGNRTRKRT